MMYPNDAPKCINDHVQTPVYKTLVTMPNFTYHYADEVHEVKAIQTDSTAVKLHALRRQSK